jgi:hypothetical protein
MMHRLLVKNQFVLVFVVLAFLTNVLGIQGTLGWTRIHVSAWTFFCCFRHPWGHSSEHHANYTSDDQPVSLEGDDLDIVLVKIGGSSLTHKGQLETLNQDALRWFSKAIQSAIDEGFKAPSPSSNSCPDTESVDLANSDLATTQKRRAFVIVHGAGTNDGCFLP